MIIVRETTNWKYPNHIYMLSDNKTKMFGYWRQGDDIPMWFGGLRTFDKRNRTFKVLAKCQDPS